MNKPIKHTMIAIASGRQPIWLEGVHPRAELLSYFGATHAEKVYLDKEDGSTVHVGYIVNGLWFTLYKIEPWEKPA